MNIVDSFIDGALEFPAKERDALIAAGAIYMRTGEEPQGLKGACKGFWIAMLPVLRNSRARSESGAAGGKQNRKQNPRQTESKQGSKREAKPEANAKQNPRQTESKQGSKREAKPEANAKQNPKQTESKQGSKGRSYQDYPSPSSFSSIEEGVQGEGFEPPDPDGVAAYFGANCLKGDPGAFYDYFAAQGWVRANGMPVEDWRALARSWSRKQVEYDAERAARGEPATADEARWKPAAKVDEAAEDARILAEYEAKYGRDALMELEGGGEA